MYAIQKEIPMYITGVDYPDNYDKERLTAAIEFGKSNPDNVAVSVHTWKEEKPKR